MAEFTPPVHGPVTVPTFILRKQKKFPWVPLVIAVLILLVAIAAYIFAWPKLSPLLSRVLPTKQTTYAVYGILPIGDLYVLPDAGSKDMPKKFSAPGIPSTQGAIDEVRDGKQMYLLLLSQDKLSSNIYAYVQGKLTQLTSSKTFKFQLSYDSSTKTFAYASGTIKSERDILKKNDWSITTYSVITQSEENVAQGTHPVLLPGGVKFLYQTADSIASGIVGAAHDDKINRTMLENPAHAAFAVNAAGTKLALYQDMTQSVLVYNIVANAASFDHAVKSPFPVSALTFLSDDRIEVAGTSDLHRKTTMFQVLGTSSAAQLPSPYVPFVPQKLIINHD